MAASRGGGLGPDRQRLVMGLAGCVLVQAINGAARQKAKAISALRNSWTAWVNHVAFSVAPLEGAAFPPMGPCALWLAVKRLTIRRASLNLKRPENCRTE